MTAPREHADDVYPDQENLWEFTITEDDDLDQNLATISRPQGVDDSGSPLQPEEPPSIVESLVVGPRPPFSRKKIIERAAKWLNPRVPYSQFKYKGGYQTDCSGYVSMAWRLGRNYWTGNLHTVNQRFSNYKLLLPGDILLYHNKANPTNGSHMVIFHKWTDEVGGDFLIFEQTPPRTKHRRWSKTGYRKRLYKPFRYVFDPHPGWLGGVAGESEPRAAERPYARLR